ncbi:hypothetical protein [Erythrobacter sp.]|jgi:hypothetical protein|uniref:hypothetical protein n=1 Tax=Erythrobacter sp. TaxID=1042 RepID=UPI002E9B6A57|nr:hypothetical protein [Erythrobacter sp.]
MQSRTLFILAGSAAALGGCMQYEVAESGAIIPDEQVEPYATWPSELEGRVARIETDEGVVNEINFEPNGVMNILVDPGGPVIQGVYGFADADTLCVNFVPRGAECWPYTPYTIGETRMVTSDRGQDLQVTLLER